MSIGVIIKKGAWLAKKYAPEILTYGGLISMVGGTVFACKQTPKAVEILNETKANLAAIKATKDEAEANDGQIAHTTAEGTVTMITYTKQDYQKDLVLQHRNNAVSLAKTYAGPALLIIGGVASVLGGHGILRKRNIATAAMLGSALEGFRKYRGNVIQDLGEAADKKYLYGLKKPQMIETINAETGEITKEPMAGPTGFEAIPDDPRYVMFSKTTCPEFYKGNLLSDLATLKTAQNHCNERLKIYGHLTVNEARELFGAKAIPEGMDNGWVIDGDGDGYVDFGLFDTVTGDPKAWVFEYVKEDNGIPVEFNIDGNIKTYLKRPRNAR